MEKPRMIYREQLHESGTDVEAVLDDVVRRLRPIIGRLRESVEQQRVGMIVGIDASGRIPALLLARTIEYRTPIAIRFVAGAGQVDDDQYDARQQALVQYFSSPACITALGEREVLVVDDIIASGASVKPIVEALHIVGIPCRVIALAVEDSETALSPDQLATVLQAPIEIGRANSLGDPAYPKIYGRHQMAGVKKGVGVHSSSIAITAAAAHAKGFAYSEEQSEEVLRYTRQLIDEKALLLARELGWAS